MQDFSAAIRTGEPPRSSSTLGLSVVRVIEAVERSLELDGAKVRVDGPAADVDPAPQLRVARLG